MNPDPRPRADLPRADVSRAGLPPVDLAHANLVRKRQRSRATVLAVILGAFVVLVFAISIAKIKAGMAH